MSRYCQLSVLATVAAGSPAFMGGNNGIQNVMMACNGIMNPQSLQEIKSGCLNGAIDMSALQSCNLIPASCRAALANADPALIRQGMMMMGSLGGTSASVASIAAPVTPPEIDLTNFVPPKIDYVAAPVAPPAINNNNWQDWANVEYIEEPTYAPYVPTTEVSWTNVAQEYVEKPAYTPYVPPTEVSWASVAPATSGYEPVSKNYDWTDSNWASAGNGWADSKQGMIRGKMGKMRGKMRGKMLEMVQEMSPESKIGLFTVASACNSAMNPEKMREVASVCFADFVPNGEMAAAADACMTDPASCKTVLSNTKMSKTILACPLLPNTCKESLVNLDPRVIEEGVRMVMGKIGSDGLLMLRGGENGGGMLDVAASCGPMMAQRKEIRAACLPDVSPSQMLPTMMQCARDPANCKATMSRSKMVQDVLACPLIPDQCKISLMNLDPKVVEKGVLKAKEMITKFGGGGLGAGVMGSGGGMQGMQGMDLQSVLDGVLSGNQNGDIKQFSGLQGMQGMQGMDFQQFPVQQGSIWSGLGQGGQRIGNLQQFGLRQQGISPSNMGGYMSSPWESSPYATYSYSSYMPNSDPFSFSRQSASGPSYVGRFGG